MFTNLFSGQMFTIDNAPPIPYYIGGCCPRVVAASLNSPLASGVRWSWAAPLPMTIVLPFRDGEGCLSQFNVTGGDVMKRITSHIVSFYKLVRRAACAFRGHTFPLVMGPIYKKTKNGITQYFRNYQCSCCEATNGQGFLVEPGTGEPYHYDSDGVRVPGTGGVLPPRPSECPPPPSPRRST